MVQFNADVVAAAAAALNFTQVVLTPPLNWIAGSSLFPSQIIAGYNADVSEYTADEWSAYMLDACQSFTDCMSVDGFQGMSDVHQPEVPKPCDRLSAQADSREQQQTAAARVGGIGSDTSIGAVLRTSHSMSVARE